MPGAIARGHRSRRYFFFEELFEDRDFEPDFLLGVDFDDFDDFELLDLPDLEELFDDFEDDLRFGTLSPSRRASEIPMATACF